jgi:hypothetical protein
LSPFYFHDLLFHPKIPQMRENLQHLSSRDWLVSMKLFSSASGHLRVPYRIELGHQPLPYQAKRA